MYKGGGSILLEGGGWWCGCVTAAPCPADESRDCGPPTTLGSGPEPPSVGARDCACARHGTSGSCHYPNVDTRHSHETREQRHGASGQTCLVYKCLMSLHHHPFPFHTSNNFNFLTRLYKNIPLMQFCFIIKFNLLLCMTLLAKAIT